MNKTILLENFRLAVSDFAIRYLTSRYTKACAETAVHSVAAEVENLGGTSSQAKSIATAVQLGLMGHVWRADKELEKAGFDKPFRQEFIGDLRLRTALAF